MKDSATGKNLDVKHYFNNLSFDIIGEIGFGHKFNSQTTAIHPFVKAFRDQTEGVLNLKARLLLKHLPFLWYVPFGPAKVLKDSTNASNNLIDMV